MTFDEAVEVVKEKYGLLAAYVDARTGKMMTVVKAEPELSAIEGLSKVAFTDSGVSLLPDDVFHLAAGTVTIKELVERKNPEIIAAAAALGSKGGKAIAGRGPEYFRQLQAKRTERKGGRPRISTDSK